ncbi:MAG: competence protein ComEC family protein [Oscillospiraceae bacterium]|nr:competence protein ComEC family protein [Oscillospiraceae bacterium]
MKRPAVWIGFSYLLGLLTASVVQFRIFLCTGIVLFAGMVILWDRTVWKYLLCSTLSCLIACCSYWHQEEIVNRKIADQECYVGQDVVFTGEITELSHYKNNYTGYILTGYFAENPESDGIRIHLFCEDQNTDYGDRMTISGIPERIRGSYVFDSEAYYQAKNIFLEFNFLTEILAIEKSENSEKSGIQPIFQNLVYQIYHWRTDMTERLQSRMGEETGGFLTGMLFGDKSGMDRTTKKALYRTGIGHLLAVSGLHLDFLAACLGFLLKKCRAGRKLTFMIIGIACGLFAICAGGTVSVKRACVMILLSQSAKIFYREPDTLNSLGIAVLLLGLENPFVIWSAGFWLSCAGAFGIGVVARYMTKPEKSEHPDRKEFKITSKVFKNSLKNIVSFCWVFLVILPVSVFCFDEISLISPFSNLLLVPVCMMMLCLGAVAICFGCEGFLADLCCSFADTLGGIILKISDFLSGLPWTHVSLHSEILKFLILAGMVFVILVQMITKDRKFTNFFVILGLVTTCVFVSVEDFMQTQELKIAVLGEGTNCVIVVRNQTEAILFDMSGHVSNAELAASYLEETGTEQIREIYCNKPSEKILRSYWESLAEPSDGYYIRKELTSGINSESNLPDYDVLDAQEMLFHGALLKIQENRLEIIYQNNLFLCTNEKTNFSDLDKNPDILTIYGKSDSIQPDCGILIIPDENEFYSMQEDAYTYIGRNDLEITIAGDGRCSVRELYDNS